jgi:predicted transcriptional regulator
MTQHDRIARILKEHPHYSATRIAALMGTSAAQVRTLCARHNIKPLSRRALEDHIDSKRKKRGKTL